MYLFMYVYMCASVCIWRYWYVVFLSLMFECVHLSCYIDHVIWTRKPKHLYLASCHPINQNFNNVLINQVTMSMVSLVGVLLVKDYRGLVL